MKCVLASRKYSALAFRKGAPRRHAEADAYNELKPAASRIARRAKQGTPR
jgi:hypothetical protein